MNFLNPDHNYRTEAAPQNIEMIVNEFATSRNASPLTLYKLSAHKWQLSYAINRGKKSHAEYNYTFVA